MKSVVITLIMLSQIVLSQQANEEKKDREPVFVLPDVVITGESDIKVGGEKKDLLPENYPIPPKETPLMDLEFIKGPYLSEDKKTPVPEEKKGSRSKSGDLITYFGTYSNYYGKLMYGQQIEKFNFIINTIKDNKNYHTEGSGFSNFGISGDFNYLFEKTLQAGLSLEYDNEILKTPYSSSLDFSELKKYFYLLNLRGKTIFSDSYSVYANVLLNWAELTELGYKYNGYDIGLGVNVDLMVDNKKHLAKANIGVRNDNMYNMLYFTALEDKFKINNIDLTLGFRFDNSKINLTGKMVYEVDNFTHLFVEYSPKLTYPVFKEKYSDELINVNAGLRPENAWFSLLAGLEHRIVKEIPVTFEIYRKEVDDYISLETSNRMGAYINISKVSVIGFNLKEEWKPFNGFVQKLEYYFANGTNKDDSSKYVTYLPNHRIKLEFDCGVSDWEFISEAEYIGDRYYKQDLSDKLNPYVLLSLEAKKHFSEMFAVFVKGENILNQEYEYLKEYVMPKASIHAGLNIKF